jgi:nicotinamide mononucleotide transporter
MQYLKDYFKDWNTWDYCWTIIASVIGTWIGLQWGEGGWRTWLSIITMLTGLWCVILVAKGRIFNYYVGVINCIGYAYIAYGYQLYGEVMLNALYFLPMQFVGLWVWRKNKDLRVPDKVRIKFMSPLGRVTWALLSVLVALAYSSLLGMMGDPVPFLDSTSTVLSVIAMILMAWRYMEQWILWIIVDIVSVWMWVLVIMKEGANDTALLVMWIAFLINAVYGFVCWIKMYKTQCTNDRLDDLDRTLQPNWPSFEECIGNKDGE